VITRETLPPPPRRIVALFVRRPPGDVDLENAGHAGGHGHAKGALRFLELIVLGEATGGKAPIQ
jgi:hypothetical protein